MFSKLCKLTAPKGLSAQEAAAWELKFTALLDMATHIQFISDSVEGSIDRIEMTFLRLWDPAYKQGMREAMDEFILMHMDPITKVPGPAGTPGDEAQIEFLGQTLRFVPSMSMTASDPLLYFAAAPLYVAPEEPPAE